MKHLLLAFLLISQFAFAVTGNKVWRIPSGGTLPAWGPVNLADGTNAITGALPSHANLPAVGQQISSATSYSNTISSETQISGLSVTITTTGRPVMVFLTSPLNNYPTSESYVSFGGPMDVIFKRGSTSIYFVRQADSGVSHPPSMYLTLDTPTAVTYTYSVFLSPVAGMATGVSLQSCALVAYEL